MIKCPICLDSGESTYGNLDCAAPNCTAATERAALNTLIDALPAMTPYDLQWTAYQLGLVIGTNQSADQVKLIRVLAVGEVIVTNDATIQNNTGHPLRIVQRIGSVEIPSPAQESELVPMLRSMWGHAIELGETDYFDDPQFGKADWQADIEAARLLLQKFKS